MATKKKKEAALIDMMGEHAGGVKVGASNESLAQMSALAQAQWEAAVKVAKAEDELDVAKKAFKQISETDLPEAMKVCGLKEFVTSSDLKITLKEDVNVGIAAPRREEAYSWLTDHDFGGLIKSDLSLHFSKDDLKKATKLAEQLTAKGFEVDLTQNIHYQTLKAFVKERMADTEADYEFPLELFGARTYQVASVKPRK
jgi:hypothetical protein